MVILNELLEDITLSELPLTKTLFYRHGIRTSAIGLKKGVSLAEHKTQTRCKICVIEGEIELRISGNVHLLTRFDTFEIAIDTFHTVTAVSHAIFIMIQDNLKNQVDG